MRAMFLSSTFLSGNVTIAYTDTGPVPDSSNYTTVVIIHGTAFNGRKLVTSSWTSSEAY